MEKIEILKCKKNSSVECVRFDDTTEYIIKYYNTFSRAMITEINILATTNHTNIVPLIKLEKMQNNRIAMVMPKLDKTLCRILSKNKLDIGEKINLLLQIAHGIRYLHYNHIIHLDIKPENIMLTNGIVHIIDFGSAEYLFDEKIFTCNTKCTVTHRPPEGFVPNDGIYCFDYNFDIWSFGIIIFEMFTGIEFYNYPGVPIYKPDGSKSYDQEHDLLMYKYITSDKFTLEIRKILPKVLWPIFDISPTKRPGIDSIITSLNFLKKQLNITSNISFDTSTNLNISCYNTLNFDNNSYGQYSKLVRNIGNDYPIAIIYATFDLLHRLAIIFKNISTQYINHAILLCNKFGTGGYTYPIYKLLPGLNKIDTEIINRIILETNGKIFQYHYYAFRMNNYYSDHNILASDHYLTTSNNFVNIINTYRK